MKNKLQRFKEKNKKTLKKTPKKKIVKSMKNK